MFEWSSSPVCNSSDSSGMSVLAGKRCGITNPAHLPDRSSALTHSLILPGQQCAAQATGRIGEQVIPTRLPAGQKRLMPFIKNADQQSAREGKKNHPAATQSTGQADTCCQYRKQTRVRQFVPGRGNQSYRHGLCTANHQADENYGDRQGCNGPHVPFKLV